MALLNRVTTFIPNTLIESSPVNQELNQLVNLLSGVSTDKDALIKYSHATDPVLRVDQLGAGVIQQWLQNGVVRASLSGLGKLLLPAGIGATPSTDQISNLGTYFSDPAIRGTPASTVETDFSSKVVAANTFGADGDFIIYIAGYNYAANANTKRVRLYFGATQIFDSGAAAYNAISAIVLGYIYRRSSSVITGVGLILPHNQSIGVALTDAGGQNFATSNTFKSTGTNGAASADDVRQFGLFVIKGSV